LSIALIQGKGGLAKQLIAKIGNDIAKNRTVRNVEYIASDLQVETIIEMYVSSQRQVELLCAEASRHVSRGVALGVAHWKLERAIGNVGAAIQHPATGK
jgi:hypothetical protein